MDRQLDIFASISIVLIVLTVAEILSVFGNIHKCTEVSSICTVAGARDKFLLSIHKNRTITLAALHCYEVNTGRACGEFDIDHPATLVTGIDFTGICIYSRGINSGYLAGCNTDQLATAGGAIAVHIGVPLLGNYYCVHIQHLGAGLVSKAVTANSAEPVCGVALCTTAGRNSCTIFQCVTIHTGVDTPGTLLLGHSSICNINSMLGIVIFLVVILLVCIVQRIRITIQGIILRNGGYIVLTSRQGKQGLGMGIVCCSFVAIQRSANQFELLQAHCSH